ncbi:MAG: N-acetylmuramoyl-L-alanine amidase family protein [Defluviitaleaceae bacterium]|nr:N-acetylmuramoyl-L-alanine amidase family protein [Defluviitaleaceae bacterium]MCL2274269.1 N-acetylmuramoyl-L-alanine amidase family protein [Defluviitaleaceae bacterium]
MKCFTYVIRAVLFALATLPFIAGMQVQASSARAVALVVDGYAMSFQYQPPISRDGRVFVPFREFTEHLGGQVGWHGAHQQVSLFYRDDVLILTVGSTVATLNGERITTTNAPFTLNERVMIPLRSVAETLGYEVDWCGDRYTAFIDTPNGNGNNGNNNAEEVPHAPGAPAPGYNSNFPILPLPPANPPNDNGATDNNTEEDETPEPPAAPADPLPPPADGHTTGDTPAINGDLARDVSTTPILPENHPITTLTTMLTPRETGAATYVVQASSPISAVSHFVLTDNRLVVDVHSARSALEGTVFVCPSLPILDIRTSQFSRNPDITRLVFHLNGPVEFNLSLSADRRQLTIGFAKNRINDVSLTTDAGADMLVIRGDALPSVRYEIDLIGRRLLVQIDNASLHVTGNQIYGGAFVSFIQTGDNADGTAYVIAMFRDDVDLPAGVGLLNQGNNAIGLMIHGGIEGVTYEQWLRAVRICRANGFFMNVAQIQRFNEYLRNRYTMVLPPQAAALGQGLIPVGDDFIDSFMLARDINGDTQLIFNTARVLVFEIHETAEAYYIMARLPREVYSMVVVIDPGHGGNDPGVIRNGVVEKDVVLTVSHKVATLLRTHPYIGVYMTRHEDTNPGLFWRAGFAEATADIMVSVHINGFTNTAIHGIETHYTISAAEVGLTFNSRHLAQLVQDHKIAQTGAHSRGLFDNPGFVVVRESNIPAVLSEMGFATNPAEAARILTSTYQWQIATALYHAILDAHRVIGR